MVFRFLSLAVAGALMASAAVPEKGQLRVGAARVDITPPADAALQLDGYPRHGKPQTGIHDPIYARAVVFDDGTTLGAVISCELLFVPAPLWSAVTERIEREVGISRNTILMASTHTHSAPVLDRADSGGSNQRWDAWRSQLEDRIVEAARRAKANLQPARAGYGTGKAYVNLNRRARLHTGGWGLGVNPEGPSDKTVGVVKLTTPAGDPIAFLINYAVHGTVLGPGNFEISGDLPGATSRFVEQKYGGKVVAAWTSAASGDQNAIYGPAPDYGPDGAFGRLAALGQILGEEVVHVAQHLETSPRARVFGAQKVVSCPGQKLAPGSDADRNKVTFLDAGPVDIRVSLLMLNHVALAGVSGEVLTLIGQRVKQESPFAHTLMVTHCNGAVGYLPDDAAYDQVSYEVATSPVKRGCAENAIVNAILEMADRY